jgi:hypothetical protein
MTATPQLLDLVWSAFEGVADEFPDDAGVMMTLHYHRWYTVQCQESGEDPL